MLQPAKTRPDLGERPIGGLDDRDRHPTQQRTKGNTGFQPQGEAGARSDSDSALAGSGGGDTLLQPPAGDQLPDLGCAQRGGAVYNCPARRGPIQPPGMAARHSDSLSEWDGGDAPGAAYGFPERGRDVDALRVVGAGLPLWTIDRFRLAGFRRGRDPSPARSAVPPLDDDDRSLATGCR